MASHSTDQIQSHELIRGLGLWAATAVVIGDTIGSSIFLVSSDMARMTGSTTLVFFAWILGGVIVLFGAFCYAELGAMFPKAGGPYVYLTEGLGPLWGFLFGWMSAFLDRPVGMAALAAAFLRFLGFIFPVVATPLHTFHFGSSEFTFTFAQPLAVLVVIFVTAVNYLSVRMSGGIQLILTTLKVGAIVLIVLGGLLFSAKHAVASASLLSQAAPQTILGTTGAVLLALVPAMWAYNGFNDLGHVGEEIVEPQKNIPRAILVGLFTVGALYLLANVVYFRTLSFSAIAGSQHVASDVVRSIAGPTGATSLTIAMAISALGALHVVTLTGARVPYAMARDGVFFRFTKSIHPRFNTPGGSLLFLGCIASLLALTGTYEQLYSLFIFAVWIFFALTAVALLRLRKKQAGLVRPYRAWGFPWTVLIFLIAAISLTLNLWLNRPVRSTLGLLVILAGIPFYFLWKRSAESQTPPA